ncbi:MAG: ATP-binding protein [Desulfobacula sp.]|jgi:two-component system sensor histidine kinase PilS (NtrC family)
MIIRPIKEHTDFSIQIRWLIISRAVFGVILIISNLGFSLKEKLTFFSQPFLSLYKIAACILILSIIYLFYLTRFDKKLFLAYFQTITDTFIVTAIVFVTGSYDSVFNFLYLVVIIYSSMLLLQKGSLIIATISCLQYSVLIELEFYQIITPFYSRFGFPGSLNENHIIYRIIIFIVACFAVAILSGILSLQLKTAQKDLKITQQHLKRVEKMAAMDEVISGIAHEIKNPLASLSGSIQLLREDTRSGSYEDKLMQIILRETERLKNIVNDIRLFSKPHSGDRIEINMADMIEETVRLFLNDPEWKPSIHLQLKLDRNITIKINPTHFTQILWNLLKNAIQSIEDKGEINIKLESSRADRVYLTIEDTGKGILPKDSNHIFDPFFTTKPEGTGLGLSILHRLIDANNGMIYFESTPGKGTIFTVVFSREPINEKITKS